MKRIFLCLLLFVTMTLSLFGCGSADSESNAIGKGEIADGAYGTTSDGTAIDTTLTDEQKIVKTVNERIETESYDTLIDSLKSAVAETGGYFVSSRYTGDGAEKNDRKASFEIRIPAEKLAGFTERVGGLATVVSYEETAQDVTLAYVDVESRIAVLEAEEKALLAILERTTSTSGTVEVRKSLSETQSNLASLRAQKKTYDTLISYSTVHLTVEEVAVARSGGSFFAEVGDTFRTSLSAVGGFFRALGVFLLGASPILLLVAAVAVAVYFVARTVVRSKKRKKDARKDNDSAL